MKSRILSIILTILLVVSFSGASAFAVSTTNTATGIPGTVEAGKDLKIIFTHDIHSYLEPTSAIIDGKLRERGGFARLSTILDTYRDENTIYVDGGDFSMGTLFHSCYTTEAYELRLLGRLGCDVTTFGNHEFDFGASGTADMLNAAMASGEDLPKIVQSNIAWDSESTPERMKFKTSFDRYGGTNYTIIEKNGIKIAVFGLLGIDGIECAPTSGLEWVDYIEAAKNTVAEIGDSADIIVCLSHSGTDGNAEGEDVDLVRAVPEIDVVISAHSHTTYKNVLRVGDSYICSAGEYLNHVGSLSLKVTDDGKVHYIEYRLIDCDENVAADEEIEGILAGYKENIEQSYLKWNEHFDDVVAYCPFDFMTLGEMYETHQEFPMGNLIADSYMYAAKQAGVDDIDVAIVGLGTMRGSFSKGDITLADTFEMCSLGEGEDGSAGHPIVAAYVTGKELKLLVELDASAGPLVSSVKMSYAGLRYEFNTKRVLFDRVTDLCLVREDGSEEYIQDDKMYKVCCNVYAANMLGMVNGLTRGILEIVPKYEDGTPVEDIYTCTLHDSYGVEIKEWRALKNYISSFEPADGVPVIPDAYADTLGRKVKYEAGGFAVLKNPGKITVAVCALPFVIGLIAALISIPVRKRIKRRRRKRLGI